MTRPRPTRSAVIRRELQGELGLHIAGFVLVAAATYHAGMSVWAESWAAALGLLLGAPAR